MIQSSSKRKIQDRYNVYLVLEDNIWYCYDSVENMNLICQADILWKIEHMLSGRKIK